MPSLRTADLPPVVAAFIGLVALTFFWYFQSIGSASDEMSSAEAWVIPIFMLAMLCLQGGLLLLASWLGRRLFGSNLPVCVLAGALFAANFFSNFLGHLGLFMIQEDWVKAVVLVTAFGFGFVLASELHQNRTMRLVTVAGAPLLLVGHFVFAALAGAT